VVSTDAGVEAGGSVTTALHHSVDRGGMLECRRGPCCDAVLLLMLEWRLVAALSAVSSCSR